MSTIHRMSDRLDEGYWQAIVTQGRWAPPPAKAGAEDLPVLAVEDHSRFSSSEMDERWNELDRLFNEGEVMCLPVMGYNKGGLLVDWQGMQGFVPISQMRDAPVQSGECDRMDYLASHVDRELQLKIIELDRSQNRIIFSQRAATWGSTCPDKLLDTLKRGDVCEGYVSNLCDFGVFVDLGGLDGLIHVSELSWQRVNHPRDILEVGQHLRVHVIDVDHDRRRVALSLKRLQNNPWATITSRYRPGMVVAATITNVVYFGAFAHIEDGVEGLIHISELQSDDPDASPADIVQEGERVVVRILSIDADNQRMALSLRGVHEDAPEALATSSAD